MGFGILKVLVLSVLLGVGLFYLRNYAKGVRCNNLQNIDGKHVIVTGANTGIGYETVKELAKRGGIIHMACRSEEKCAEARKKIITENKVNHENIRIHKLDLSSLKSIIEFTEAYKSEVKELDILINNAGVMMCPYSETADGFELQIGTNHLGHFLLTNELIPLLKNSKKSPRIIIVSSEAHRFGSINRTNINVRSDAYGSISAYGQSKLANIMHAQYLSKKLKSDNVAVVSLHPGSINTELQRHLPNIVQQVMKILGHVMIKTPYEGAQTQICAAVDSDIMSKTGKYLSDCVVYPTNNAEVFDTELENWLWKHSEELINEKLPVKQTIKKE